MLVLLIRGQLLERFPTLSVYAYPIDAQENRPGGSSPPVPAGQTDPKEMDPNRMVLPVMKGHLGKDITYTPAAPPIGGGAVQGILQRYTSEVLFDRMSPADATTAFIDEVNGTINQG